MHLLTLLLATVALAEVQQPLVQLSSRKDVLTPEIDNFIVSVLKSWNSPAGVAVAIVQKNDDESWNIEKKGYGIAQADGSKVTEDTLFAIGSNSKVKIDALHNAFLNVYKLTLRLVIRCHFRRSFDLK
jgi:CubicO group peptidase (beta-lactamase class C family)